MRTKIILSTLAVLLLSGCQTSPSLYTTKQKVPQVEKIIKLPKLKPIKVEKRNFTIEYKAKNTQPNMYSYVNTRGSIIDLNKLPSVVIALPVEDNQILTNTQKLEKTGAFKTEGYINKAEEVVEKELIRAGFSVIDRSKFEAKLRTQRESNRVITNQIHNNSLAADIEIVKEQLKNNEITKAQMLSKIAVLEKNSKTRTRDGQKELIDMSELIRAAQGEGVKADYILQLNTLEEYNGYVTQLKIKGNSDVDHYISKNDDITYGTDGGDTIPYNFNTKVYQVVFGAKLFNVQTGKVVWAGSHKLNSLDIEDITASFSIVKKDTNSALINNKINRLNNTIISLQNKSLKSQKTLEKLYAKASKEREYKNENTQTIEEQKLKNNISMHEKTIKSNNTKINKFNSISKNYNNDIEFKYVVSDLFIDPNLNLDTSTLDNEKQEIIKQHRSKLLGQTIRSLFKTIKVKNY